MSIRKGRAYNPSEVLPFVCSPGRDENGAPVKLYRDFDGDDIKMSSTRLRVFATKGLKCVKCGIEGSVFYKEKSTEEDGHWHFNLYAIDAKGREILMTKDHMYPRSRGGTEKPKNLQTMCQVCNVAKGNKVSNPKE